MKKSDDYDLGTPSELVRIKLLPSGELTENYRCYLNNMAESETTEYLNHA